MKIIFDNGTEVMVDLKEINHVVEVNGPRDVRFPDINSWLCDQNRAPLDERSKSNLERVRAEYDGFMIRRIVEYFDN